MVFALILFRKCYDCHGFVLATIHEDMHSYKKKVSVNKNTGTSCKSLYFSLS